MSELGKSVISDTPRMHPGVPNKLATAEPTIPPWKSLEDNTWKSISVCVYISVCCVTEWEAQKSSVDHNSSYYH